MTRLPGKQGSPTRTASAWTTSAAALLTAAALGGWPATASADAPPLITTIAGGVGGPGPVSEIPSGGCVVTYSGGNLYTQSTAGAIRKISLATGHLSTLVGTGYKGPVSDGQSGPGSNLEPSSCGIAVDRHGNVLFADGEDIGPRGGLRGGNNLIRVVANSTGTFYGQPMTKGKLYSIAGDGSYGFSGDGGPARSAQLGDPAGLAVDQHGNVVIADAGNNRVRVLAEKTGTFYAQAMKAGDIYAVAGDGVLTFGDSKLGDDGPATKAELALNAFEHRFLGLTPAGASVRVDHQGNIVVADQGHGRVRVIANIKGRFYGQAMRAGFIYTIAGGGKGKLGDGNLARNALLRTPTAVAIDHSGNVVIADQFDQRVRVVPVRSGKFYGQAMKAEHIYTVAGDGVEKNSGNGGPATKAGVVMPAGVSVDGAGNLVISGSCLQQPPSTSPAVAAVSLDCLRVVAERPGRFYGQAMKKGDIYAISGVNGSHFGDGGPALQAAFDAQTLFSSDGFAAGQTDGLAIGDSANSRVRLVPAASARFFGEAMTAGHIYTIAGDGKAGYKGDGGDGASAEISYPGGLAFDQAGNVLIADPVNFAVRVVAVRSGTFYGRTMTGGHIYTIAGDGTKGSSGNGGLATLATLNGPGRHRGPRRQRAHRRHQRRQGRRDQHRHVLRSGDDRRPHLRAGRRQRSPDRERRLSRQPDRLR